MYIRFLISYLNMINEKSLQTQNTSTMLLIINMTMPHFKLFSYFSKYFNDRSITMHSNYTILSSLFLILNVINKISVEKNTYKLLQI